MAVSSSAARNLDPPVDDYSPNLRDWQRRALQALERWQTGSFLISAAPGAGKTRPALEFARHEFHRRALDGVVIACPTAPLTRQWARAAHELGLNLVPDADSPRPPQGFHGVVVTYARIASAPRSWGAAVSRRTLVIADETHHLGEDLAWGQAFSTAFEPADRWLLLSGTPFRSDATPIPGVQYDADGYAEPDIGYGYADAVREGVCRPVVFVTYDGSLSWRSGEDVIESNFETVLSTREASRRYRTAISTELPDGLPRILKEANTRLTELRAGPHPQAAGLVIAADSEHARRVAKRLREVTGSAPVVVLHADPRSAQKLAKFTNSDEPWIVAVNMVSEGVDIPRLRVGVYASAAKTPLIFRQIVGRFVRTIPGRPLEPSWLYIPAEQVLRDHAANVEQELSPLVGRKRQDDPFADELELDEPQRRATEPSAQLDFEPLSADVAPQLTLFGPAPETPAAQPAGSFTASSIGAQIAALHAVSSSPARLPATSTGGQQPLVRTPVPTPGGGVPAGPAAAAGADQAAGQRAGSAAEDTGPAFERRAKLRSQRHRLVSELARHRRTSQREINSWINRELGIDSVPKATVEQLARSVELLERTLYGKRR